MPRYSSVDAALEALEARNAELARQLAEAQRGSDAEAALDAVWTQALGIEHSDDTLAVAVAIFEALRDLGVPVLQIVLTGRRSAAGGEVPVWIAGIDGDGVARGNHRVSATEGHPILDALFAKPPPNGPLVQQLTPGEFADYLRASLSIYPSSYAERVVARVPDAERYNLVGVPVKTGQSGPLLAILSEPSTAETVRTLERFAILFGLAFARFRDLQRAEAQARTAQVDAVVERVRARAQAMEHSSDLDEIAHRLFECLGKLGIETQRSTLALVDEAAGTTTFWSSVTLGPPTTVSMALFDGHPFYDAIWAAMRRQEDLVYILEGDELARYRSRLGRVRNDILVAQGNVEREYVYAAVVPVGTLTVFALRPFSEDTVQVIRRLVDVFAFAYGRTLNLRQAERRARAAAQSAAVDRVRAEIATMRTVADLDRVTPLLWQELTELGVPFVQCSVLIVDEAAAEVQALYSTPEGALTMPIAAHPVLEHVIERWHDREPFVGQLHDGAAAEWAVLLDEHGLGGAQDARGDALAVLFAPFAQGVLYVGSSEPLTDDDARAVQALADAFEVAYARYDDFQRLEARRREVEAALDDLKAAQQRLIQSEKLASLGALTAGIAHEIKNPLNFVNNFAALSREIVEDLLEELGEELGEDGLSEDVRELLGDLSLNAERIEQHGRRADSIVRSMMQHARGSEGERSRVSLNALVEQHVNLAYHGRRARSPEFSLSLQTDYTDDDPTVAVMEQEVGRVLINLANNAFDAVMSRAEAEAGRVGYEPTVRVATSREGGYVTVRVEDNGTGIGEADLERVFEPFYTTKPPGKGTGLGLSMSHDIVERGHGGTLRVESELGEGTTFILTLPA